MSLPREEIIRMAREAGLGMKKEIQRIANAAYAAGASAEREACAKVCERFGKSLDVDIGGNFAEEIRARNGWEK